RQATPSRGEANVAARDPPRRRDALRCARHARNAPGRRLPAEQRRPAPPGKGGRVPVGRTPREPRAGVVARLAEAALRIRLRDTDHHWPASERLLPRRSVALVAARGWCRRDSSLSVDILYGLTPLWA